ncbi:hypothetical protein [Novosphingobium barchaimii]|uniref:hypothetical protein n=1 Tax=Novosphingobium barchaimii TaxID=1420591 RepID=UPI0011E04602|nr:hypothetical protein [Novosphingobium barchaimii]
MVGHVYDPALGENLHISRACAQHRSNARVVYIVAALQNKFLQARSQQRYVASQQNVAPQHFLPCEQSSGFKPLADCNNVSASGFPTTPIN